MTTSKPVSSDLASIESATFELRKSKNGGHKVILEDVIDHALIFADRPFRTAHSEKLKHFIGKWSKTFAGDPPNAVLTYSEDGSSKQSADRNQSQVVFEMVGQPRYKAQKDKLIFNVRTSEEQAKANQDINGGQDPLTGSSLRGKDAALFIDCFIICANTVGYTGFRFINKMDMPMRVIWSNAGTDTSIRTSVNQADVPPGGKSEVFKGATYADWDIGALVYERAGAGNKDIGVWRGETPDVGQSWIGLDGTHKWYDGDDFKNGKKTITGTKTVNCYKYKYTIAENRSNGNWDGWSTHQYDITYFEGELVEGCG